MAKKHKQVDIAIIGGGPAGLTSAIYAARGGASCAVFERLSAGGQAAITPDIENYPGFKLIGGLELGLKMAEQAEHVGAEIIYDEVESLSLKGRKKTIELSGLIYTARAVILATGAEPRKLGVMGEQKFTGRGVSYCATCDGSFYKGKTVAVCGGGNTAIEDVIYLADLASKVYLIHRRAEFRAESALVSRLSQIKNLHLVLDSVVTNISGEKSVQSIEVENVLTKQRTEIDTDALFVAVGSVPNTALFSGEVKLNDHGYIPVKKNQQTNLAGVYAAGDVTDTALRQVITAAADGAKAASAALKHVKR